MVKLKGCSPVATTVVLVMAAGALAGCGNRSASTPRASITLYSGQHEQTTQTLVAAFERQTGIHVNERDADEDTLAQQIEQEGSKSPADVFYTENTPPLVLLGQKRLLAPVAASTLAVVPARYDSAQGDWVGVSARVSVLVYNTSALRPDQVPTSAMALADRKWKGRLALAPTETDFQPLLTAIARSRGTAAALGWLEAVKGNAGSRVYPDNETVTSDINSGRAALGIINHYYWFRLRAELGASKMHSALAYLAPQDPGYVLDVSGAAVLRSSKHQAEAQQLLAFLVGAQGETLLAHSDSFEYPLGSGVAADSALKPFDQLEPTPVTLADLGDGSTALHLLQAAQLA